MPADTLSDEDAAQLALLTHEMADATERLRFFVSDIRLRYHFAPGDMLDAQDHRTIHRSR